MYIEDVKDQMNLPESVRIFDTTLRDGEQTPGVALTVDEKIGIARKLDKLGVDTIEAGFPAASPGEMNSIGRIVELDLDANTCGLARVLKEDIDAAIDCGVDYIHTFIGTSPLHRRYKLKMSPEEIIEKAVFGVEYAADHGLKVEFSAEDATRTEFDYLLDFTGQQRTREQTS